MSRLCLDTSAYSRFRRGDAAVAELLDRAEWVGVPAVVLGALRTGFALGDRRDENETALDAFLDHPAVHEVPIDSDVSRHYAEIVVELRRQGTPIPTNDVWIAAAAARAGATVVTFDEHFRHVRRVGTITPAS